MDSSNILQNYRIGAKIWIPHEINVYVEGILLNTIDENTKIVKVKLPDNSTKDIQITSLEQLPILQNPDIVYGKRDIEGAGRTVRERSPPHIYAITEEAHYNLRNFSKSQSITKRLTLDEAIRSRDALTKLVYCKLFNYLIEQRNEALNKSINTTSTATTIGILDIYGFEIFQINSFEQFCINYANEKLHQQYNEYVFKQVQEEYAREEIEYIQVDHYDNQRTIDLIERPIGLINLLDEQCKRLNELWRSAFLKK
ncbi:unnamed protein product [Caenorhabditis angaria]|uniref:Myosin motor domain-containing protein n=1 Tax=Caenorhabditis angaria TaxID=860376 RepID=A0A9P1I2L5_9PELO|nr:unnamed protein product [Caenorhabditis angaria]